MSLDTLFIPASFQSTPSVWRETVRFCTAQSDLDFNPLPPCGGRLFASDKMKYLGTFQSTPSVWRETRKPVEMVFVAAISIHSLRVEGDH